MNQKGITLISLIITIIVMAILVGVTVTTMNLIENAERQKVISEMILIKNEAIKIREKYNFNGDASAFAGLKLSEQANKSEIAGNALTSSELNEETYYIYNQETLNGMNLEGIILDSEQVYIVNYADGDVIKPEGIKNYSGDIVYRLSEIYN